MALNIPMPESPGKSLLQGLDTGSSMMSRIMQPVIERERMKQQQAQFAQDYILKKQAQDKANALMPYMIQQYQDVHKTAVNEQQLKAIYNGIMQNAMKQAAMRQGGGAGAPPVPAPLPGMTPQTGGEQPNASSGGISPQPGAMPNAAPGLPAGGQEPVAPPMAQGMPNQNMQGSQEYELRAGRPELSQLDAVAGLLPMVPKPVQHFSNGMIFTTYPSGRMTAQKVQGAQLPGERTVSAKEASKIRDQATALVNSANLVQQGYDLLDNNDNLTGPGNVMSAIPIPFSGGSKINLSNNPELGKFNTVTGKLQAELGKYAASRGGVQAVKWAASVKPSAFNPEDYNYGMFDATQESLKNDYNALNEQYKAATGQELPIKLPDVKSSRARKGKATETTTGKGKVTKWKMTGGQLVKE